MRLLPCYLAFAALLFAGCFDSRGPSNNDSGGQTTGDSTREPDAPTGDATGKRPLADLDANLTGETGNATVWVHNEMPGDAYLFLGFRPRSLVPETPCNVLHLRLPANSSIEIHCTLNLLSDGMLVLGAEWFDRPEDAIPRATVRHVSESGAARTFHYDIRILPFTAMMVNRTL